MWLMMNSLLVFSVVSFARVVSAQIVTLPDGTKLQGAQDVHSIAFKGIPYAEPPIGSLRWTPPQKYQNPDLDAVIDATNYGNICYQERCVLGDDSSITCSEDCLFLNVFVSELPTSSQTALLPVTVYIYGGTYVTGASNDIDDGEIMSYWGPNSGIVVSINYRLNVFGFLGSDELRVLDTEDGSTGNYGIQDQRMALKWVKENIAAFGGDPDRVSIFGESAGAGSVTQHLSRPKSWDYFNSVAMESGAFPLWSAMNLSSAEKVYSAVADKVGCSNTEEESILSCLSNKTTEQLFNAGAVVYALDNPDGPYMLTYAPVIDGVEATTHPWISLANGNVADVPMMFGFNRDEGVSFTTLSTNATEEDVDEFWRTAGFTTDDEIAELHSLYIDNAEYPINPVGNSIYWWAAARSSGDLSFSCPARYVSQTLSTFTNRNSFNQTYVYYFTHLTEGSDFVEHTYELAYVFELFYILTTQSDQEMSNVMGDLWGSFFFDENHDPNQLTFGSDISKAPHQKTYSIAASYWPPYSAQGDEILNIINATNLSVVPGLKKDVCDYFIPWLDGIVRRSFDSGSESSSNTQKQK